MRRPRLREPTVLLLYAALAAVCIAWVPWLGPLAYPFRLLVTLVHELSHGLAALATGGDFRRLVVAADGAGLAYTAGGWRPVVIAGGYLGAAAFAGGLVLLGANRRASRWALGTLGVVLVALALRYGLPSLLSEDAAGGALAVLAGISTGAAFVTIATRAAPAWVLFTIHLVAIEAGLGALSDLWTLIGLSGKGSHRATDARAMAEITFLPAIFWACVWALAAGVVIGLAIRAAWCRRSA